MSLKMHAELEVLMEASAFMKVAKVKKAAKGTKERKPRALRETAEIEKDCNTYEKEVANKEIPRPCNGFLIHRNERARFRAQNGQQKDVSRAAGTEWHALTDEERARYNELARLEGLRHKQMYPDYKYCPRDKEGWAAAAEEYMLNLMELERRGILRRAVVPKAKASSSRPSRPKKAAAPKKKAAAGARTSSPTPSSADPRFLATELFSTSPSGVLTGAPASLTSASSPEAIASLPFPPYAGSMSPGSPFPLPVVPVWNEMQQAWAYMPYIGSPPPVFYDTPFQPDGTQVSCGSLPSVPPEASSSAAPSAASPLSPPSPTSLPSYDFVPSTESQSPASAGCAVSPGSDGSLGTTSSLPSLVWTPSGSGSSPASMGTPNSASQVLPTEEQGTYEIMKPGEHGPELQLSPEPSSLAYSRGAEQTADLLRAQFESHQPGLDIHVDWAFAQNLLDELAETHKNSDVEQQAGSTYAYMVGDQSTAAAESITSPMFSAEDLMFAGLYTEADAPQVSSDLAPVYATSTVEQASPTPSEPSVLDSLPPTLDKLFEDWSGPPQQDVYAAPYFPIAETPVAPPPLSESRAVPHSAAPRSERPVYVPEPFVSARRTVTYTNQLPHVLPGWNVWAPEEPAEDWLDVVLPEYTYRGPHGHLPPHLKPDWHPSRDCSLPRLSIMPRGGYNNPRIDEDVKRMQMNTLEANERIRPERAAVVARMLQERADFLEKAAEVAAAGVPKPLADTKRRRKGRTTSAQKTMVNEFQVDMAAAKPVIGGKHRTEGRAKEVGRPTFRPTATTAASAKPILLPTYPGMPAPAPMATSSTPAPHVQFALPSGRRPSVAPAGSPGERRASRTFSARSSRGSIAPSPAGFSGYAPDVQMSSSDPHMYTPYPSGPSFNRLSIGRPTQGSKRRASQDAGRSRQPSFAEPEVTEVTVADIDNLLFDYGAFERDCLLMQFARDGDDAMNWEEDVAIIVSPEVAKAVEVEAVRRMSDHGQQGLPRGSGRRPSAAIIEAIQPGQHQNASTYVVGRLSRGSLSGGSPVKPAERPLKALPRGKRRA